AVYALFADERGTFEFRIGMPAPEQTIATSTENLVLEAVRRLDEARRDAAEQVGPDELRVGGDAVPLRATQAEELLRTGAVALTPEERSLVENADGIRTVARIAAQAGLDAERAQVVAQRLVKTGVLKLQTKRARTARRAAEPAPARTRRRRRRREHRRGVGAGPRAAGQAGRLPARGRHRAGVRPPAPRRRRAVPRALAGGLPARRPGRERALARQAV